MSQTNHYWMYPWPVLHLILPTPIISGLSFWFDKLNEDMVTSHQQEPLDDANQISNDQFEALLCRNPTWPIYFSKNTWQAIGKNISSCHGIHGCKTRDLCLKLCQDLIGCAVLLSFFLLPLSLCIFKEIPLFSWSSSVCVRLWLASPLIVVMLWLLWLALTLLAAILWLWPPLCITISKVPKDSEGSWIFVLGPQGIPVQLIRLQSNWRTCYALVAKELSKVIY